MDVDKLDQALTGQDLTNTDFAAALGVFVIGTLVAYLVGRGASAYFGRPQRRSQQVAKLLARLMRWCIQIIAVVWTLSILGLGLGWLTIIVGLVAVAVVLAAKPLAENLAASWVLVSRPAFAIGDEVEIEEYRGEIIEITERSTILRLRDGRRVHIPNTEVVQQIVVVYTTDQARRTSLNVTVHHKTDIDEAERVILAALAGQPAILADPAPNVRARDLTYGVRLSVRFWHDSRISEGNRAQDQAVRAIKTAFSRNGIAFASPELEIRRTGDDPSPPSEG